MSLLGRRTDTPPTTVLLKVVFLPANDAALFGRVICPGSFGRGGPVSETACDIFRVLLPRDYLPRSVTTILDSLLLPTIVTVPSSTMQPRGLTWFFVCGCVAHVLSLVFDVVGVLCWSVFTNHGCSLDQLSPTPPGLALPPFAQLLQHCSSLSAVRRFVDASDWSRSPTLATWSTGTS